MKNLTLLIAGVSCLLLVTSCRQEYQCYCSGGWNGGYEATETVKASSRKRAHVKCQKLGAPPGSFDAVICTLK